MTHTNLDNTQNTFKNLMNDSQSVKTSQDIFRKARASGPGGIISDSRQRKHKNRSNMEKRRNNKLSSQNRNISGEESPHFLSQPGNLMSEELASSADLTHNHRYMST